MVLPQFFSRQVIVQQEIIDPSAYASNIESQTFNVFNGKVSIGFGSGSATTGTKSYGGPSWDQSLWQLQSAQLIVNVVQNVNDGANVTCIWNEGSVGAIDYGVGATGNKQGTFDITSSIIDGSNTFEFQYNETGININPFGSDVADISAQLVVTFNYIGTGTTPPGPPSKGSSPFSLNLPWWVLPTAIGVGTVTFLIILNNKTGGGVTHAASRATQEFFVPLATTAKQGAAAIIAA